MNFEALQPHVAECLAANDFLAPLTILQEFAPLLTAAELAQNDARFEFAIATQGVALVILSPIGRSRDTVKRSGLAMNVTVPIAICENPEVNRGPADPTANPARRPFGHVALRIQREVITALLPYYNFPATAGFDRPTIGVDGLLHYYLLPERTVILVA